MRIVSAHQRTAEVRAKNTKKWIEKEDIEGLNLNKRISESNICCYNGKEQVNLAVASLVEAWIETLYGKDIVGVVESPPSWRRGLKRDDPAVDYFCHSSPPSWRRGLKHWSYRSTS